MDMNSMRRRLCLAGLLAGPVLPALAQFRVEVTGVGLTQLPIAVATFRGDDTAPQKIAAIIQADLERSGQFLVDEIGYPVRGQPQVTHGHAIALAPQVLALDDVP